MIVSYKKEIKISKKKLLYDKWKPKQRIPDIKIGRQVKESISWQEFKIDSFAIFLIDNHYYYRYLPREALSLSEKKKNDFGFRSVKMDQIKSWNWAL